jgi:hypothetical protein
MTPIRELEFKSPSACGIRPIWLVSCLIALAWQLSCVERPGEPLPQGPPGQIVATPGSGHAGPAIAASRPGTKVTERRQVPVTHWTECSLLDSAASPRPELTSCSSSSKEEEEALEVCTARDGVALVVDDDAWTREHRSWRWLEERPWGVFSEVCQRTGMPQPLATDLPWACETIQRLGGGSGFSGGITPCEPNRDLAARQAVGANRALTPARQALKTACGLLLQGATPLQPHWNLVVLAFDGVPDEPGSGSPAGDFARTLAQECVSRGVGVHVVARPATYRYLYVLSSARHHEFAGEVANRLAILLDEGDSTLPVVGAGTHKGESRTSTGVGAMAPRALVLNLTPYKLTHPGERRALAKVEIERAHLEGFDGDSRQSLATAEAHREDLAIASINVSSWLASEEKNRAAWQLKWTGDAGSWQELASAGTLLGPPEVHGNKPAATVYRANPGAALSKPATAWRLDALNGYREMKGTCPAHLNFRHIGWIGEPQDCPNSAGSLYHSATLEPGSLSLELFRDRVGGLEWLVPQGDFQSRLAGVPLKAVEDIHDPAFVRALRGTEGESLASFALVSPALSLDRCAGELHNALLNTSEIVSRESQGAGYEFLLDRRLAADSVEAACKDSPLRELLVGFRATPRAIFLLTLHGRTGAPTDLRVGMETLAGSIFEAAAVATRGSLASNACLLGGLRVVYECPAPDGRRK